jgi:hypothetical protein
MNVSARSVERNQSADDGVDDGSHEVFPSWPRNRDYFRAQPSSPPASQYRTLLYTIFLRLALFFLSRTVKFLDNVIMSEMQIIFTARFPGEP